MSAKQITETIRADDFLEYFLFPDLSEQNENGDEEKLEKIRNDILESVRKYVENHIWHKDPFQLIVRDKNSNLLKPSDQDEEEEELPPHLHGITFYGENVQDEWLIVELLFHLTKIYPGLIARVIDSDGEFMLIEAAEHLPQWANPDTCMQRVYIYNGDLLLVQNSPSTTNTVLSVSVALEKIRQNAKLYKVPESILKCITARFADSKNQVHRTTVYLPAAAVTVLNANPSLISAAVRTFCNRDQIDMKSCRAMKHFPPETRCYSNITFTRCLYAMLTHARYTPDRRTGWNLPPSSDEKFKAHNLGMKIACGFEILVSKATPIEDDVENDKSWHLFLSSLKQNGFFGDNIEHSKEYCKRLENAKEYYKMFADSRPISTANAAHEALKQLKETDLSHDKLKTEEMQTYNPIDDNEDWLNISSDDLDKLLAERYGIKKTFHTGSGADELQTATDLTENLQTFLDQKSEFDGVDFRPVPPKRGIKKKVETTESKSANTMEGSDSYAVNFDPDAFQNHLKEMLDFIIPEDNWDSHSDMSDFDDECVGRHIESMSNEKKENDASLTTYMEQMDRELAGTTIGKSFTTKPVTTRPKIDESFDDIESFEPVDIDVNALQNLAESYQAQFGGHGPAASLLGSLGLRVDSTKNVASKEEPLLNHTEM